MRTDVYDDPGFVVANLSAYSWLPEMAGGLARGGALRRYISPLGMADQELRRASKVLPAAIARRLELRRLPSDVQSDQVRRIAMASELAHVAALRLPAPKLRGRLVDLHRDRCDRIVARQIRTGDLGVIVWTGTSIRSIRRASELSVPSVLDYPITHHDYTLRMMHEEARLVPEYAPTLQGHDLPIDRRRRWDDELAAADYILTMGSFHRSSFLELGFPESKVISHPLGVDSDLFQPRPRDDDGVFRIAFSGQITQRKGISYLVDGFEQAAIPNSELLFIGRPVGPMDAWASKSGVRHQRAVPRHQLPGIYSAADVFVMPSLLEGFGLTGLEAMSMGIPTITTTNTFGPDVITDGVDGFVVPIRDAGAIADRLHRLYAEPDLRRRMGESARDTALQYDWTTYGDSVAAQLCELVGTSAPA